MKTNKHLFQKEEYFPNIGKYLKTKKTQTLNYQR